MESKARQLGAAEAGLMVQCSWRSIMTLLEKALLHAACAG
jgi:hypothetical protein